MMGDAIEADGGGGDVLGAAMTDRVEEGSVRVGCHTCVGCCDAEGCGNAVTSMTFAVSVEGAGATRGGASTEAGTTAAELERSASCSATVLAPERSLAIASTLADAKVTAATTPIKTERRGR